jgi:hypothetical protein
MFAVDDADSSTLADFVEQLLILGRFEEWYPETSEALDERLDFAGGPPRCMLDVEREHAPT